MKLGFCNGIFDLAHEGHGYFLRECAAQCDGLVIGINSDESTKALKGDARPVDSWDRRALKVIKFVVPHCVVKITSNDHLADVMRMFNPQVVFRGWDQNVDDAPGFNVVRIPRHGEYSTTAQIEAAK